jgi:hypothetical protein
LKHWKEVLLYWQITTTCTYDDGGGAGGKNPRLVRNWNHNSKGFSTLMVKVIVMENSLNSSETSPDKRFRLHPKSLGDDGVDVSTK